MEWFISDEIRHYVSNVKSQKRNEVLYFPVYKRPLQFLGKNSGKKFFSNE